MTGTIYQQKFDKYRDEGFHWTTSILTWSATSSLCGYLDKIGRCIYRLPRQHCGGTSEIDRSLKSDGMGPKVISVASVDGKLHYTALYTKQAIGSFEARSFLTPDEYQTKFDQNKARGRHLHHLKSYLHEDKLHFSAIWAEKPEVSGSKAHHGLTAGQFLTRWEDAMSTGFRTRAISGCEVGGKVRYAVYWTKGFSRN